MDERPRLTIPEPRFRPGDDPDFSGIDIPGAGETRRPDVDAEPREMRDLADGLIRVLGDDNKATGPWQSDLTAAQLIKGLTDMMRVREFDRRMMAAQRQGKTSFYMQCLGEEAIACAFRAAMADSDMNFPTYRQQGLLIAHGYPLVDMMNQVYSNEEDPIKGRQLPIMYSSRAHGFFTISGNLATQFIQAVGWAMAASIKGEGNIAAGWIGDGATAESDFHSAMVFASTYQAPVVLNIVNNQWAISSHQSLARGRADTFAAKGIGFGIPALRVDGNDYLASHSTAVWALERARRGLGPTLIEWVTYRAAAHSSSDDPSAYRPPDEAAKWPLGDPIERLADHLIELGEWSDERQQELTDQIEEEVRVAQAEAESHGTLHEGPKPTRDIFEGVYEKIPPHLQKQRDLLEGMTWRE
ncbi:MAG: 3-methyl-2-oxobutanoate dehydrogenase (2-methylpropanoyl-transferring) subunit alpha [Acidimicrobiia bacterium]|nr:3-methyl-2-oxobutanoate dehydrogenase (2-methylpropanoyl-transferring) subunit alpha [Acidimicrobiia bacterium]